MFFDFEMSVKENDNWTTYKEKQLIVSDSRATHIHFVIKTKVYDTIDPHKSMLLAKSK